MSAVISFPSFMKSLKSVSHPPKAGNPQRKVEADISKEGSNVIGDVREIEHYRYMDDHGLPDSVKESFAVMAKDETNVLVLVSIDQWAKNIHVEISRRLKDKYNAFRIQSVRASSEVIRTLHTGHVRREIVTHSDVERIAWTMIEDAVSKGASDLHIESRVDYAQVYFRIYGERVEQKPLSRDTAFEMCNVLYSVHADAKSKGVQWTVDKVLDTGIEHTLSDGRKIQIRFSSSPIHPSGNFHMVARLLMMDSKNALDLPRVGYDATHIALIEDMIVGAQGVVLLVGPTNSGKSTSMQSFARKIKERRGDTIKMLTVEDPVEYIIPGACQMGVPQERATQSGSSSTSAFHSLLKGTLRQDPDVVIVGEIRDAESASTVKDLVLAGRKLLTTMHVYEAMAVFARLREIGVPESVLYMSGFISGIIYQRLVPVLCNHCSIPVVQAYQDGQVPPALYDRLIRAVDLERTNVKVRSAIGCEKCGNRGIVGRTVCAEVLVPDAAFLSLMQSGRHQEAREYWMSNPDMNIGGMGVNTLAHALSKMMTGQIDPRDIESQISLIQLYRHEAASARPHNADHVHMSSRMVHDDAVDGMMSLGSLYRA